MAAPMVLETCWSIEKEDELVEMWGNSPSIFDFTLTEYSNRVAKACKYKEMSQALGFPDSEIKKKLKTLRNQYVKAKKQAPSGSANKVSSRRTLWILEKLKFLEPFIGQRSTKTNLHKVPQTTSANSSVTDGLSSDEENPRNDDDISRQSDDDSILDAEEDIATPKSTKCPTAIKSSHKTKKMKQDEEELEILKDLAKSLSQPEPSTHTTEPTTQSDGLTAFTNYVNKSMCNMGPRTQNILKNTIQNAIFQAQMGMLPGQQQSYTQLTPVNPAVSTVNPGVNLDASQF